MPLAPGLRLGPYEILCSLGSGGMGEVYRARDSRLGRDVAIKILPAELAADAVRKQRFEREAKTISTLNHPNICVLHDVGSQNGVDYLVMECVEGDTLAKRLEKGALPLDQVLKYGAQIADALDKAHRTGIVHRDLKPGNIILTSSGAKLLDFGLAKPAAVMSGATLTAVAPKSPVTQEGTIVGTFQYMSPEQLEGKELDGRSDIFSLGAVLYEMVTGRRAFEGKSQLSVASAILEKEPSPITTIKPMTPPALDHIIRKSLAKIPDDRWQSASDLASELSWMAESELTSVTQVTQKPAARGHARGKWLGWVVAIVVLIAAIALGVRQFAYREAKPLVRTQINAPEKVYFNFVGDNAGPPVISPDGTQIVFSASADKKNQLYLRSIRELTFHALPGTENGTFPFWSPDSRSIAFFADNKLKRVDVAGGPPVIVCEATQARGGDWSANGVILFAPTFNSPLFQVPASGGTPVAVTKMASTYTTHRWPSFLPDGQHFIYLAANHVDPSSSDTAIFFASLDGKENRFLAPSRSSAIYASGSLLYVRDNALVARPLNPSAGQFQGEATVLNDDVEVDAGVWHATFTVSQNGTLLYQPGSGSGGLSLSWFDRSGTQIGTMAIADAVRQIELSPDDKKVVVSMGEPLAALWVYDLTRNTRSRLTFGNENYSHPVWSADENQIAYTVGGGAANDAGHRIQTKPSNGAGEEKPLFSLDPASGMQQGLCDWSPDGRYLLYRTGISGTGDGFDLWLLPLFGDRKPFPYAEGPGDQLYAQFSPDGLWVAYTSNETGRNEVYVAPFPRSGAKWQVSQNGGSLPRWRRDGKELFFAGTNSGQFMAAQVNERGPNFEVGEIRELFTINNMSPSIASAQYDVSADGRHFFVITTGQTGTQPLTLVQNWTTELKKN